MRRAWNWLEMVRGLRFRWNPKNSWGSLLQKRSTKGIPKLPKVCGSLGLKHPPSQNPAILQLERVFEDYFLLGALCLVGRVSLLTMSRDKVKWSAVQNDAGASARHFSWKCWQPWTGTCTSPQTQRAASSVSENACWCLLSSRMLLRLLRVACVCVCALCACVFA